MLIMFDLDGTLIDSLEAWLQSYKKVVAIPDLSDAEVIGLFFFHHKKAFEKYKITDAQAFYASLNAALETQGHLVTEFEHVEETLVQLKREGHTLGILTSRRKEVAKMHCPAWLLDKFDVLITGSDTKPKPAPDGILKASEMTEIPLSETIFVGDYLQDAECAKAAGVPFIFFKQPQEKFWKHYSIPDAPSFSNFKELPALIEKIRSERAKKN